MGYGLEKKKNNGFTLVEMLVVAAIIMILTAVSFVAVLQCARSLKVTEMDNMAREIYLAAEHRAVALANSGKLTKESLVTAGGTELNFRGSTANLWYIHYSQQNPNTKLGDLMPVETIEPTLWKGSFYIVYDLDAGCVKDVFFDETENGDGFTKAFEFYTSTTKNFQEFYAFWFVKDKESGNGTETSRKTRADNKIYIGHYGGDAEALPKPAEPGEPIEVQPEITITNGDELELRVKYAYPNEVTGWELRVDLTYAYEDTSGKKIESKVSLPANKGSQTGDTYTWTLDTLELEGPHFKDWFWKKADGTYMNDTDKGANNRPPSFGGEFRVNAVMEPVSYIPDRTNLVATPAIERKANSLFADATNNSENTAYIENLRHLQNLDKNFSGVEGKTEAHQIANIDAGKVKKKVVGNTPMVKVSDYEFIPVQNDDLILYKSYLVTTSQEGADVASQAEATAEENAAEKEYYSIQNLTVTQKSMNSMETPGTAAGLFSEVKGKDKDNPFKFENVRMINTSIDGSSDGVQYVGALAGTANNAQFNNCRVYWDDPRPLANETNGSIVYRIHGKNVGGLVGQLEGGTITNSFAATTISGDGCIGGLVGVAENDESTKKGVEIKQSYADCYLYLKQQGARADTGASDFGAGGLIGVAKGGVNLKYVYSAGFIESAVTKNGTVAGFCVNQGGTVTASNAYATMHYTVPNSTSESEKVQPIPLTNVLAGTGTQTCYYVNYSDTTYTYATGYLGVEKSYSQMISTGDEDIIKGINEPGENVFERKPLDDTASNPYRLGENGALTNYDLPGLKGLPHYGDWKSKPVTPVVWIVNGEELQVKVRTKASNKPKVKLEYGGASVIITDDDLGTGTALSNPSGYYVWTVTLDSLTGKHFKDWNWKVSDGKTMEALTFGGDFTALASYDGNTWSEKSKQNTNNSLFEEGSNGTTAYIANLRHLQNLDTAFSGAEGKTAAMQTADIDAGGFSTSAYTFKPIAHNGLQSYTVQNSGEYYKITNLNVNGVGLFANVTDTKGTPFKFTNIRLNVATISSKDANIPTGAIVGAANGSVVFDNCQVTGSTVTGNGSTGGLVGDVNGSVTFDNCQVAGSTVTGNGSTGGLVGNVTGSAIFNGCSVAGTSASQTTVTGGGSTGGLVGNVTESAAFNGCNVAGTPTSQTTVTGSGSTGGLVGNVTKSATFTNCTGNQVTVKTTTQANGRGYGGLAGYVGERVADSTTAEVDESSNVVGTTEVNKTANITETVSMTNCRMDNATVQNATVTVDSEKKTFTANAGDGGGFQNYIGGLVGYVKDKAKFSGCSVGLDGNVNVWGTEPATTAMTTNSQDNSQAVFVGGVVGYVGGNATDNSNFLAENCRIVKATVKGVGNRSCVGGLTGYASGAMFTKCIVGDTVRDEGTAVAGAVAIDGSSDYQYPDYTTKTVDTTISYNKLNDQVGIGGMVGYAKDNVTLSDCQVVGNVLVKGYKTADHVGGLVGYANNVDNKSSAESRTPRTGMWIERCEVKANDDNRPTMESGAGGSGVGAGHVGGMVGFAQPNITLTDCTADSIVVQKNKENVADLRGVGGLVGFVGTMPYQGTDNTSTTPTINATGKATLTRCKTIGSTSVTSTGFPNSVGGLVGYATVADFKGCEVGSAGSKGVTIQGSSASVADANQTEATTEQLDNSDDTVFVGGMIGSSASNSADAQTTFDKDDVNGNVCKVVNTTVTGQGPRAYVGGIMGLAEQTTFANCVVGEAGDATSVVVTATKKNNEEATPSNDTNGIAGYANNNINESVAGGVLGKGTGKTTITQCAVSNATITAGADSTGGQACAGGIIGKFIGSNTTTKIELTMDVCTVSKAKISAKSSDSNLKYAGDLVGYTNTDTTTITKTDCNTASEVTVDPQPTSPPSADSADTMDTTAESTTVDASTLSETGPAGAEGQTAPADNAGSPEVPGTTDATRSPETSGETGPTVSPETPDVPVPAVSPETPGVPVPAVSPEASGETGLTVSPETPSVPGSAVSPETPSVPVPAVSPETPGVPGSAVSPSTSEPPDATPPSGSLAHQIWLVQQILPLRQFPLVWQAWR